MLEKKVLEGIIDVVLDVQKEEIDNKSIEEQFSYYSLKTFRQLDLYFREQDMDVDKQDKLIPILKYFTENTEKIMKGEE